MRKSIVATAAVVTAIAASTMMGCGMSFSSTVTKTETVTDANGNTTSTTTTTVKDNNGRRSETQTTSYEADTEEFDDEGIVADISFDNETGMDIVEMYFASPEADDWGNEILGEDAPLADGEILTFHEALTYHEDSVLWDLCIVDEDGNDIEFNGLDVSEADDPEDIVVVVTFDEATETFTVFVE